MNILSVGDFLFFTIIAGVSLKIASEMIKTENPIYFVTAIMLAGVYIIAVIIIAIMIFERSANKKKDAEGIKK